MSHYKETVRKNHGESRLRHDAIRETTKRSLPEYNITPLSQDHKQATAMQGSVRGRDLGHALLVG